jgi:ATP-dependent Clp protease ATP-binding subunit ClpA
VDLSQTLIFMTSNLGGVEISDLMNGGLGFAPQERPETQKGLNEKVGRTAEEAAKRKFAPEFMNRIDKVIVFHPLRPEQLEKILEIELGMVQQRVLETARGRFLFRVTPAAREFLLKEGTDLKYGARHLKRAIERYVVYPLASLLATEQVALGDVLSIDWDDLDHRLVFLKEGEGALIPMPSSFPGLAADSAKAITDGRAISVPATSVAAEPPQVSASASRTHVEKPENGKKK